MSLLGLVYLIRQAGFFKHYVNSKDLEPGKRFELLWAVTPSVYKTATIDHYVNPAKFSTVKPLLKNFPLK